MEKVLLERAKEQQNRHIKSEHELSKLLFAVGSALFAIWATAALFFIEHTQPDLSPMYQPDLNPMYMYLLGLLLAVSVLTGVLGLWIESYRMNYQAEELCTIGLNDLNPYLHKIPGGGYSVSFPGWKSERACKLLQRLCMCLSLLICIGALINQVLAILLQA